MKKIISVLLILCVVAAAFADDLAFKGITAVDSRAPAMGGNHVADTSDYFTLLRNPAGLAFSGRHNLIGQTTIIVGGPISETFDMIQAGSTDAMLDTATGLMSDNKMNLGLTLGGPIAFGGTYRNGFGWGLFDQVLVNASVPSTVVVANMEVDVSAVFGYGHNFSLGEYGDLAVGISTDIYAQAPYMSVQKNMMDLLGGGDVMTQLTKGMSLGSTIGANFNAGLQYEIFDFLSAGLVWNNFLGIEKKSTPVLDLDNLDVSAITQFSESKTIAGKGSLDIGVGFDIPTSWSLGIISDWTAYADWHDLIGSFKNDPLARNPILNLGLGTEMTLLNCIALRGGISDSYLNAGIGLRLLGMHMDFMVYGKELGVEPGATPQMNMGISFGIRH